MKDAAAVNKHLLNMGSLCEHPSAFRAAFYSHRLLENPRRVEVKHYLDEVSKHVDTAYYTISEKLNGLDLSSHRIAFKNFSESENSLM